jgi:hypothetical protein
MQDPGVEVHRRISFKATNLIGSFQDDVKTLESKTPRATSARGAHRIAFAAGGSRTRPTLHGTYCTSRWQSTSMNSVQLLASADFSPFQVKRDSETFV